MPKAPRGAISARDDEDELTKLVAGEEGHVEGASGPQGGAQEGVERARAPTPRAARNSHVEADGDEAEGGEVPTDFAHPALREQRPIWVAADVLGVGAAEVRAMRAEGVEATLRGARMDGDGSVDVWEGPGDEEEGK